MKKAQLKLMAAGIAGLFFCSTQVFGQVGFSGTINSGAQATALGLQTTASGSQSTALGYMSNASGLQSFAAGHWSTASGPYSFGLGARSIAAGRHAMSFGIDVRANADYSMTIGTGISNSLAGSIQNNIQHSLMVGFNSNIPTLFVGPSSGANTIGRVGIGTTTPAANLDVTGNQSPNIKLHNAAGRHLELGLADCNGCYASFATPGDAVMRVLGGGDLIFAIPGINGSRQIGFETAGARVMTVQEVGSNGKVGIGTMNFPTTIGGANISGYKLFVEGGILAEEIRVRTGWADYVFQDDYRLRPLTEVAEFIENHGHLPNVPSAAQVESEGIEIGEISKIQQEKIEELTLYVIELQKQLDQIKAQMSANEEK